jgi:hypothetical protein
VIFRAIADDGDLQTALTRAEGGLQVARALVFDTIGAMWDSARAGDVPTVEQRARFLLAAQEAMRTSIESVDTVVGFAGIGAIAAQEHRLRAVVLVGLTGVS